MTAASGLVPGGDHPAGPDTAVKEDRRGRHVLDWRPPVVPEVGLGLDDGRVDPLDAVPGGGLTGTFDVGGVLGVGGVLVKALAVIGENPVAGYLLAVAGPGAPVVGGADDAGVDLAPVDDLDLVLRPTEPVEQYYTDRENIEAVLRSVTL